MNVTCHEIPATQEEFEAFQEQFNLDALDESHRTLVTTSCLGPFLVGYRAGKAKAEAVQKDETLAFYTMDQMRDFADGVTATRLYCVIDAIVKKARDLRVESAELQGVGKFEVSFEVRRISEDLMKIANSAQNLGAKSMQGRIAEWSKQCFGENVSKDKKIMLHRFAEEAIGLMKLLGMEQDALGNVAWYVFNVTENKDRGVGATHNALAALCSVEAKSMLGEAEEHFLEVSAPSKMEELRRKQECKPDFSVSKSVFRALYLHK